MSRLLIKSHCVKIGSSVQLFGEYKSKERRQRNSSLREHAASAHPTIHKKEVNVTSTIPKYNHEIVNWLSIQFTTVLNCRHELIKTRFKRGATQRKSPTFRRGACYKIARLVWLVTYENSTLLSKRASLFRLGRF
jgi:hypothetical protein